MSNSNRDILNLSRSALLEDYSERSKRGDDPVVRYALRNSSTSVRDILIEASTGLGISSEELKKIILAGKSISGSIKDPDQLGNLGRLVLLQNKLPDDIPYGERLLQIALKVAPSETISFKNRFVLLQHYIVSGNIHSARWMIDLYPDLKEVSYGFLPAELDNPFTYGTENSKQEWLDAFNRVFIENDLSPVSLDGGAYSPFDQLTSLARHTEPPSLEDEPLVSVVLTTYQPDQDRLITSIKSLLNQTWRNLEIIVVDDHSGKAFRHIFEDLSTLDDRIRIIYAPYNRGTYVARNIGYEAATGEYITGQDDDDWSHPERIAHQVATMTKNPKAIGCRVRSVRCDEALNRVFLSKLPIGQNASSLLIRREVYEASGGYLKVRKAGDTEFHKRIEKIFDRSVVEIKKPLSIIRMLPTSLSRGDFGPGWMHDSRHSFRSSYSRWHETSAPEELKLSNTSLPPIQIPQRIGIGAGPLSTRELDVVFAGDWQSFGGPQKSMLEEIKALSGQGLKIGVLHLEAARFMYRRQRLPLTSHIQDLINVGTVQEIFYDEDVAIRLLILRYPPILQFFKHERSRLAVDRMLIVANQAPAELDGSDVRYLVGDVDHVAQTAFGVSPVWVPQGPQIRKVLRNYLQPPRLAEYDMPGIVDPSEWWPERLWYRSAIPIVGRHSRDNKMKWPNDPSVLEAIYRTDGNHDVRIMGGASTALAALQKTKSPSAWTVYKADEIPVQSFLNSLDYFVYFQHPNAIEAFGRAILEAIASGLVVILPQHFEEVFGDAAVYANPGEVTSLISYYHSDFSIYHRQLQRSREVLLNRFSHEAYRQRIQSVLLPH